jgi:hypothetical protein
LGAVAIVILFGVQLIQIQLRLSRNGELARQLVESARHRFPAATITGTASYEKEVIYLYVSGLDEATNVDLEGWLRDQKTAKGITAEIWLRLPDPDALSRERTIKL